MRKSPKASRIIQTSTDSKKLVLINTARIKEWAELQKLSVDRVAVKAGISYSTMAKLIAGQYTTIEKVWLVEDALNLPRNSFVVQRTWPKHTIMWWLQEIYLAPSSEAVEKLYDEFLLRQRELMEHDFGNWASVGQLARFRLVSLRRYPPNRFVNMESF